MVEKGALRYTPAGVPLIRFRIVHRSRQEEAGGLRLVQCELPALAAGELACTLATWPREADVRCEGFLARAGRERGELVLHVQTIELTE